MVKNKDHKTNVSFGIRADNLNISDITQRLGIKPTWSFSRGDMHISKINKSQYGILKRPWGVWAISSENDVSSDELQDHVDYIINTLEPKRKIIELLLKDNDIYINIWFWIVTSEMVSGLTINSRSFAVLASLSHDINFTFNVESQDSYKKKSSK